MVFFPPHILSNSLAICVFFSLDLFPKYTYRTTESTHRYTNSNRFLGILFSSLIFSSKCSFSLCPSYIVKPLLLWHFSLFLCWLCVYFFYQHRLCLACVCVALSFSLFIWNVQMFIFESEPNSGSYQTLYACVCVVKLNETQLYIDSIMVALKGIEAKNENERKNEKKTRNSTNTLKRIDTESPSTNT